MFDTKYKEPETAAEIYNRALAIRARHKRLPVPNYVSRALVPKALPAPVSVAAKAIKPVKPKPIEVDRDGIPEFSVSDVIDAIVGASCINRHILFGFGRLAYISNARKVGYYLCYCMTKKSTKAIGLLFGGRDHTTVLYGCREVQSNFNDYKPLIEAVLNRVFYKTDDVVQLHWASQISEKASGSKVWRTVIAECQESGKCCNRYIKYRRLTGEVTVSKAVMDTVEEDKQRAKRNG